MFCSSLCQNGDYPEVSSYFLSPSTKVPGRYLELGKTDPFQIVSNSGHQMWRTWEDENLTQNFSQNLKVSGYLGPRIYVIGYYSCPSVILIPWWFGQFWADCSPVFPFEIIAVHYYYYYSVLLGTVFPL